MSHTLLLADDDVELCQLLQQYLEVEGFKVSLAHDGKEAVDVALSRDFDLLILDVMLPSMQGFDVLRTLRQSSDMPVLMLTARGDDTDRIVGLELGADDYLPKPCNPRELSARIKAILRRSETRASKSSELEDAGLHINEAAREARYQEQLLELTSAEFNVLVLLLKHRGTALSKEQLTEEALGRKLEAYDRSIDVHVSNLRKKLAGAGIDRDCIKNIRGIGYQWTGIAHA